MKHLLIASLALFSVWMYACERPIHLNSTEDLRDIAVVEEEQGITPDNPWDPCFNSTNCGNCVFYAACRMGHSFPLSLFKIENKCKIINRSNPKIGYIAIIDSYRPYGHVAYVSYVTSNGQTVHLHEGGWNWTSCNYRTLPANDPSIIGYYEYGRAIGNHDCSHYGH